MSNAKTLSEFILDYMTENGLSARKFANLVGVSNTTINRALGSNPPTPSLKTLKKLAEATGQNLETLVLMASPGSSNLDTWAKQMTSYILTLPPDARGEAETYILGLLTRAGRKKRLEKKETLTKRKMSNQAEK